MNCDQNKLNIKYNVFSITTEYNVRSTLFDIPYSSKILMIMQVDVVHMYSTVVYLYINMFNLT
jgi:hypothetical protein